MNVEVRPDQEAWLRARVALGEYSSVDEAVRQVLAERIAEENDDMAWAKPLVEEALVDVANGQTISFDEYRRRTAARLAGLKD